MKLTDMNPLPLELLTKSTGGRRLLQVVKVAMMAYAVREAVRYISDQIKQK